MTSAGPLPVLSAEPLVSVLVATWNENEDLERFVRSFRQVSYVNKELILAIGGAHEVEAVQHLAGTDVRLVEHPGGGLQRAHARCLEEAHGQVILVTDADCILDSESFWRLVAPIANGEESVVTGTWKPLPEQQGNWFVQQQWAAKIQSWAHSQVYLKALSGRNYAVSRAALEAAGRFDADVPIGDDAYLAICLRRAGYRIRFQPGSYVYSYCYEEASPYIRQQARWLRTQFLLGIRFSDARWVLGALRSSVVSALVIALTLLTLSTRHYRPALFLIPPVLQSYLSRLRALRFAASTGLIPWRAKCLLGILPALYMDYCAWAMPLLEYPFPKRRRRW